MEFKREIMRRKEYLGSIVDSTEPEIIQKQIDQIIELEWIYVEQAFKMTKGSVCKHMDKYLMLDSITHMSWNNTILEFLEINEDLTVSDRKVELNAHYVELYYRSLDEFIGSVYIDRTRKTLI